MCKYFTGVYNVFIRKYQMPCMRKCVCGGDDVVTCPDCGTPHHRECYQELGKCANKNLHGTDFVFNREEEKDDNQSANQTDIEDYYIGENADNVQAAEIADEPVQQNNSDEGNNYKIPRRLIFQGVL